MWAATYGSPPNLFQTIEHEAFVSLLPRVTGCTVLDLGCGSGRTASTLLGCGATRVVGVDRSRPMLCRAADSSVAALWVEADAIRLPLPDVAVDVVVSTLMFGHIGRLQEAIGEAVRVLRPGGHLVVSDFHPQATLSGWQRAVVDPVTGRECVFEQHLHLLSDYVAALEPLGVVVEALREPCHEGTPVAFVLRARKRQDGDR